MINEKSLDILDIKAFLFSIVIWSIIILWKKPIYYCK